MLARLILCFVAVLVFGASAFAQAKTRYFEADMMMFDKIKRQEFHTKGYYVDIQDLKAGKIWHTLSFDEPAPPHRTIVAFDHSTRLPNGQWQQEYGVIKGPKNVVPVQVMITNGELRRIISSRPQPNNERTVATTIYKDGKIIGTTERVNAAGTVIGGGTFTTKPISAQAYQAGLKKITKQTVAGVQKALPSNK